MGHQVFKAIIAVASAGLMLTTAAVAGLPASPRAKDIPVEGHFHVPAFTLCGPAGKERGDSAAPAFTLSLSHEREEKPSEDPDPDAAAVMPKKWGRAILELGALLTYSTIRYWLAYRDYIEDWQYRLTFKDQVRRFFTTEALRFDSNCFMLNWTHGLAGALYYQMGRANHLTWLESALLATAGSSFYEYVGEWREVISINDQIVTSLGSYPLGEPWYQLGLYFHHRKSFFPRVLGFLNPFVEFNQWLDRKDPASKIYVEPGWHGFEIQAGWRRHATSGRPTLDSAFFGLDMQLIHVPEYGRPGVFRRTLRDTMFTELSFDMSLRKRLSGDREARDGLDEEANLFARVVSWASYRQDIDELSRGHAVSLGLGSAFSYVRRRPVVYDSQAVRVRIDPPPDGPVDFRDKISVVHIAGPVLDWTSFGRGWKLRAMADAYLDFAMVGAAAINEFSRIREVAGLKTTLAYYGYHYAWGTSFSARFDLEWRNLHVRGLASGHIWDSIEGLDRFQADILDDSGAVDTRTRYLLKASWRWPGAPLRVFAAHEGIRRWGRIDDIEAGSFDTKTSFGLSFVF